MSGYRASGIQTLDQHARPLSMITTFVVRCLDSLIPLFAIAETSRPKLVSVAEQAGLSLNWSQTLKAGFVVIWLKYELPHLTKPTKWPVRPAKTQISLGISPVWSESSMCAQRVAKDPSFLHADSENSDQTGAMPYIHVYWSDSSVKGMWFISTSQSTARD